MMDTKSPARRIAHTIRKGGKDYERETSMLFVVLFMLGLALHPCGFFQRYPDRPSSSSSTIGCQYGYMPDLVDDYRRFRCKDSQTTNWSINGLVRCRFKQEGCILFYSGLQPYLCSYYQSREVTTTIRIWNSRIHLFQSPTIQSDQITLENLSD